MKSTNDHKNDTPISNNLLPLNEIVILQFNQRSLVGYQIPSVTHPHTSTAGLDLTTWNAL
jgi:hypothetical protein